MSEINLQVAIGSDILTFSNLDADGDMFVTLKAKNYDKNTKGIWLGTEELKEIIRYLEFQLNENPNQTD